MKYYLIVILFYAYSAVAQPLDKVIAVVGDHFILESELRIKLREEKLLLGPDKEQAECIALYNMIQDKMLLVQAARDSVIISDEEVEAQMEQRLNYFVQQFGSKEALEEYFGKKMSVIENELKSSLRDQLTINRMRGQLLSSSTVSPNEVRKFFKSMPRDSIPFYNTEFEIGQIIKFIEVSDEAKDATIKKLKRIRQDIISGKDEFEFAAIFNSEDPGSQPKGGDLGMMNRNDFVPEFSAAAFKLKKDSISGIVETQFGYHIIKLIDRKGDNIHLKHILLKPKVTASDRIKTKNFVDSIRNAILHDTLTFEQAAYLYSDDEDSKNNGGMMYDPQTGATRIPVENLDPSVSFIVDTMRVNQITNPLVMKTRQGNDAYRLLMLKSKVAPHQANLEQDYPRISEMALAKKSNKILRNWALRKAPTIFIRIDEEYLKCKALTDLLPTTQN